MRPDTYSLYEAKTGFSAIIRRVREGHRVIVTLHGRPVAEIRPFEPASATLAERLRELAARGVVVRPAAPGGMPERVVRRPGALARFLADRDE